MLFRRDIQNHGRPLSDAERTLTLRALLDREVAERAICEAACDATRLYAWTPRLGEVRGPRSLIAHVALASRADGITLGSRVFIRRALFERPEGVSSSLIAHEVCHVAQVLREGWPRFYARYLAEYARGIARGLGDRGAYLAISYEVEAREVGQRARHLSRPPRPD